jgi:hypothetical protein
MYINYEDITDRIADSPQWWLNGVPRYGAFSPGQVDVYAREVALLLVEGQYPEGRFQVGVFSPSVDFRFGFRSHLLAYGDIDSGDPPNYKDRATPHMSTSTIRVLQYWKRDDRYTWHRDSMLEMRLREDESDDCLLPDYVSLAKEKAGPAWEEALASHDSVKLRGLLVDVNCPYCEEVVRLVVLEAVSAQHCLELNQKLSMVCSENGWG